MSDEAALPPLPPNPPREEAIGPQSAALSADEEHGVETASAEAPEGESASGLRERDIPLRYLLLFLPTFLLFCYFLIPITQRLEAALKYPFEIDGEEGFVYLDAVDLRLGRSIYRSIDEEPFTVGNYPPLFPWTLSKLINPERVGLPIGRALVAVSSIAIVQLLLSIVSLRTRRLLPALLAPLLFVISYEFHNWSAFCRVDLPALALTLLGVFIFMAGRSRWVTALSAIVFVLAAFTRVTSILAPAACCLSMLASDRRRLPWFLVPYLGIGFGAFAILNHQTGGQFFMNVVRYNENEMDWVSFRRLMVNEIGYFYRWWGVALVAGMLALWLLRGEPAAQGPTGKMRFHSRPHARLVSVWYFVLAILSLATFAKRGSAPNYALEPLAAAAIFGMETLGRLCDAGGGGRSLRRSVARMGVAAMGLALLLHGWWVQHVAWAMFSSRNPTSADRETAQAVLGAVRSAEGDVLTEFPLFSLLSGKRVTYEPFVMSRLAAEGVWDEQKIIDQIRGRRFGLILTSQDLREVETGAYLWRFTPRMARAILQYYSLESVARNRGRGGLGQSYYLWLPSTGKGKDRRKDFIAFSPRGSPRSPALDPSDGLV